jgi:ABC-type nitrate/sulfonate/bicarbonate transport system substrate-binding protein
MALLLVFTAESDGAEAVEASVPIRIGWQIPAATQAQIAQVLKRTNLLESHGLEPSLVPFSYGEPQIEAALAGSLDVVFAGDQPVINLIARGGRWKIVARLFYDRIALMVPLNSPIQGLRDLRGKTVASPFGSVAHRVAILKQRSVGLDANRDVRNVDLDILEIRRRVLAGGVGTWGTIDAVAVWEPSVSSFELSGLARSVSTERTLGVVAVSEDFIADHPQAVVQFLAALMRAWNYLSHHFGKISQWYIDDAQLGYTREALSSAANIDPNWGAKSLNEIDLSLSEEHLASLQQGAAWQYEQDQTKSSFRILQAVDQGMLAEAMKKIAEARFEDVETILPPAREAKIPISEGRYFFDALPLWFLFILIVLITLLSIEAGQWLGLRRRRSPKRELEGPVGTVVAAVLALLAFMLALTFGAASNRFDARKGALLDDTNAIGTAYLRAGLLPEPHRTTTQSLLRDYVEMRIGMVEAYGQPAKLQTVQARAGSLQATIWSHAERLAEENPAAETYALFASALNEVFDLHTKRIVLGAEDRVPLFVWVALILVSCVAMTAVGFQFGIAGRRSFAAELALSLTFTLVMLIIFDLDRPGEGLIKVNQRPMIELYQSLSKPQ